MDAKEPKPENSRDSTETMSVETVVVIETQAKESNSESNRAEKRSDEHSSAVTLPAVCDDVATPNSKVVEELELSKVSSCVIDVNCGSVVGSKSLSDNWDPESVCRICHLSSDRSPERRTNTSATTSVADLIHLGCVCKDDLGVAHYQCAEAWFKLKGNRVCEICGEPAKNVTGVGDIRFMEEWNERVSQSADNNNNNNSSETNRACWRGQPFCNFLMACLVIAFVLPWFFRVNMF